MGRYLFIGKTQTEVSYAVLLVNFPRSNHASQGAVAALAWTCKIADILAHQPIAR